MAGLSTKCNACQKEKLVGNDSALIQPKLKLGQVNDRYEQEADQVADRVMGMTPSNVQPSYAHQTKSIQDDYISRKISPLVQRQEPKGKPKSNEDKLKEGAKKVGEAFLKTKPGKKIVEIGTDAVTTLPGSVIAGTAAVGVVTALVATNKALPIQAPAIPLDVLHPGLSMKITVEGPLRSPTKAMISFSGKFGLPDKSRAKKDTKTKSEKMREENFRLHRELVDFRESLKSPEEKERDRQRLMETIMLLHPIPGLKPRKEVPTIEPEKKEDESVQRKEVNNSTVHNSDMSLVGNVTQSTGKPLYSDTRSFMEQRFGYDFNQVKIHTGADAEQSAKDISARAYTLGNSVVMAKGEYHPDSDSGKRLLAHELTHVIQQAPNKETNR